MPVTVMKYPAPYGAGTNMAMGPRLGLKGAGIFNFLLKTKYPLVAGMGLTMAVCAIPFLFIQNPETSDERHQAAQRAYMRYHNMNPIFGASSKQARASES